jgi:hypothetical protein
MFSNDGFVSSVNYYNNWNMVADIAFPEYKRGKYVE